MRSGSPLAGLFPDRSPYMYAFNSPLNFSDPSGLAPKKEKGRRAKFQAIVFDEPDELFPAYDAFFDNHVFFKNSVIYKGEIIVDNTGMMFSKMTRTGAMSGAGGGGVNYSVSKETYSCNIEGLGYFSWDVYEVTFHDNSGITTITMSVDGIVERNLSGNISAEDLVYQTADAMANVMERMGGVRCFEAVTNITHINITDNAKRYYKKSEHKYYDALITNRRSGSTIYLSAELVMGESRNGAELEPTLAHEIGHNVFWNFVDFNRNKSMIMASYLNGHEFSANYFALSIGYFPLLWKEKQIYWLGDNNEFVKTYVNYINKNFNNLPVNILENMNIRWSK